MWTQMSKSWSCFFFVAKLFYMWRWDLRSEHTHFLKGTLLPLLLLCGTGKKTTTWINLQENSPGHNNDFFWFISLVSGFDKHQLHNNPKSRNTFQVKCPRVPFAGDHTSLLLFTCPVPTLHKQAKCWFRKFYEAPERTFSPYGLPLVTGRGTWRDLQTLMQSTTFYIQRDTV